MLVFPDFSAKAIQAKLAKLRATIVSEGTRGSGGGGGGQQGFEAPLTGMAMIPMMDVL